MKTKTHIPNYCTNVKEWSLETNLNMKNWLNKTKANIYGDNQTLTFPFKVQM